ncbi:hypothetical protein WJX74_007174 [Apatococcus lobatus]|uniref:Uncharacterized protein n=1 Tax=Apatococcus lobatus TaxID=904363 RepID=A0AAW1Q536_9CHLO
MAAPSAPRSSRSTALQRVSRDLWKVLAVIAVLAILLLRTDLAYSHSKPTPAEDSESTAIRGRSRVLSGSAGESEPAVVEYTAQAQTAELRCPAQRQSFSQSVQEGSKGLKDAPPVSPDECAAALHLPKLALLFLTVGSLPHDKLWSDWFASAKGLVPRDYLEAARCEAQEASPDALTELNQVCQSEPGTPILDRQHLFSVHVHTSPTHAGFGADSVFHGREIAARTETGWGKFGLTQALINLLAAGLEDPLNQQLLMLSESCVPLYPPAVVYSQIMHEEKSRINACAKEGWNLNDYRWSEAMETPRMKKVHFRKNWTRFGLLRTHAETVLADTEVATSFRNHCHNDEYHCLPDEHYFSTVLAVNGLENQTDCDGNIIAEDWHWAKDGSFPSHPRAFQPKEIDGQLVADLRQTMAGRFEESLQSPTCFPGQAVVAAESSMADASRSTLPVLGPEQSAYSDKALNSACPLFARKFPAASAAAVQKVLRRELRLMPPS